MALIVEPGVMPLDRMERKKVCVRGGINSIPGGGIIGYDIVEPRR